MRKTIFYLRRTINGAVRGIVRILFDRAPSQKAMGASKHVVVLRWDAKLGDSIVSSHFYREIRKLPGVRVTVVTVAELAEIHRQDFGVDRVIVTSALPSFRELQRVSRELDAVDAVVHLVGRIQPLEIIFLNILKAASVYSLDDSLRLVSHKLGSSTKGLLFAEKYSCVLESLGLPATKTRYSIALPSVADAMRVGYADIVLNPYGSRGDKSLSNDKAAELLAALAEAYPVFTIGILSCQSTRLAAKQLELQMGQPNVRALEGIETPRHAAAAVNASRITITVDTAIVHMAVGLGKKLVAIYPDSGNEPNPWLPPTSCTTRLIISRQDVQSYKLTGAKNMNQFSSLAVVEAVRMLDLICAPVQLRTTVAARLIRGIGAANGTLYRQLPLISVSFPEVAECHPGTINLQLETTLHVRVPDHRTRPIAWTPSGRTREVFDLVRVELELAVTGRCFPAWLYVAHASPHRGTPTIHELIARPIDLAGEMDLRLHIRSSAVEIGTT